MVKLIVFDCDGVMFDSRETNRAYYDDLLKAFGRPPMTEEELAFVHVYNVTDSVNHIFRNHTDLDMAEVHRFRTGLDYTPYLRFMVMEPDLLPFLKYASELGYKLAISTNRTTTMRPLLQSYGLSGYFDMVVTAADVVNPKPAPDALLQIMRTLNCAASETIFIGDSSVDREHSKAAGVPLIAFKNKSLSAEYHVDRFMDIAKLPLFQS